MGRVAAPDSRPRDGSSLPPGRMTELARTRDLRFRASASIVRTGTGPASTASLSDTVTGRTGSDNDACAVAPGRPTDQQTHARIHQSRVRPRRAHSARLRLHGTERQPGTTHLRQPSGCNVAGAHRRRPGRRRTSREDLGSLGGLEHRPGPRPHPEGWEPTTAEEGRNDFGETGYGGPNPPDREHTYRFELYALDDDLDLASSATATDVRDAAKATCSTTPDSKGPTHPDGLGIAPPQLQSTTD